MNELEQSEIFVVTAPGLEPQVTRELTDLGFAGPIRPETGGVVIQGGWPEVWRANLELRSATRVLIRIAAFRAPHLAQLDKRAHKVPWDQVFHKGQRVRVDVVCRASRIYHKGAAAQRIMTAITDAIGAPAETDETAAFTVKVRIDNDLCTISLDTTGEPLHRRGHKEAVGKAPLRETLAAAFLRDCGFDGREAVVDPMCGSGTLIIEAAEIAAGLQPGRSRAFAFEQLASSDAQAIAALRRSASAQDTTVRFYGYDRDDGAIRASTANAARAGVEGVTAFARQAVSDLTPPDGPPGLVIVNPPYGARIGNRKLLFALYGALGKTLKQQFPGWRVGVITSDDGLAKATDLPFLPVGPQVDLGGLKVRLWRCDPL